MSSKYDEEHQVKLETLEQRQFNADTLKVMRYFLRELQAQGQKTLRVEQLVELLDNLIIETYEGVTPKDKQRQRTIEQGQKAFVQGKQRQDNPHQASSDTYTWWETGWRDAAKVQQSQHDHVTKATAKAKNAKGRYRVQCVSAERCSEWNETLHQYVQAGGGTLFADYDEAQVFAKRLANASPGPVSIIDTFKPK